jgi:hypothetical protein
MVDLYQLSQEERNFCLLYVVENRSLDLTNAPNSTELLGAFNFV